jgi:peptidylprolyl isomerase
MKFFLVIVIALVIFLLIRSNNNKALAEENIKIGEQFLATNRTVDGVVETESGLQYQVLKSGEGTEHPKATSKVSVHYHGTLLDGSMFDSSVVRGKPLSFGLNQVIKGWTEGVQLMVEGDKFKFFIPATLG